MTHGSAPIMITLQLRYYAGGRDITGSPYANLDATEVHAWDGAFLQVATCRDEEATDRWRITGSDATIPAGVEAETFGSPSEALDHLAGHGQFAYHITTG